MLSEAIFDKESILIHVIPDIERANEDGFKKEMIEIDDWALDELDLDTQTARLIVNFSQPLQIS